MKLFLDDFRHPVEAHDYMRFRMENASIYTEDGWRIVRSFDEFIDFIKEHAPNITVISFDHDLADEHYESGNYRMYKEKTGYECAKWMIEYYTVNQFELPEVFIHSLNPVGVERIKELFNGEKKRQRNNDS